MSETSRDPAIRVSMLPRDTNGMGTIFGGAILSYLDLAGGIEARRTAPELFVTRAMHEVEFTAPIFVGDTVSFYTCTERVGRTSVTVSIDVFVERRDGGGSEKAARAVVTYVAVDERRRPVVIGPREPAGGGGRGG